MSVLDDLFGLSLGLFFLSDALISLILLLGTLADFLSLTGVLFLLLFVSIDDLFVHLLDKISVSLVLGLSLGIIDDCLVNSIDSGSELFGRGNNGGNDRFLASDGLASSNVGLRGRTLRFGLSGALSLCRGGSGLPCCIDSLGDKGSIRTSLSLGWALSRCNRLLLLKSVELGEIVVKSDVVLGLEPEVNGDDQLDIWATIRHH